MQEYLQIALGKPRLQKILKDMCTPPLLCTVRVNLQRCSTAQVLSLLKAHPDVTQHASGEPYPHSTLSNVVCIPGEGQVELNFNAPGNANLQPHQSTDCSDGVLLFVATQVTVPNSKSNQVGLNSS